MSGPRCSMKNICVDFIVSKRLSEDFVLLMIMHLKTIPALVDVQQLAVKFTQVSWYCCKPFTDVQITFQSCKLYCHKWNHAITSQKPLLL